MTSTDKLDNQKGKKLSWKSAAVGAAVVFILLIALVVLFATPSADVVFRDMKSKMLQTNSLTLDQSVDMSGETTSGRVTSKMFLDMSDRSSVKMSGDFTMSVNNEGIPMTFAGKIIKVGDNNFVKYSDISSTSEELSTTMENYLSRVEGHWIKTRSADQLSSFATGSIDFTLNIIPTPFANLTNAQRDDVLKTLNDSKMYSIEESSKVDINGVSAYKYQIKYDHDLYLKAAKAIHDYQEYLKTDSTDSDKSEITSMTVWVNINTRQIIKIEYTGTSNGDDIAGKMNFTDYGTTKSISQPSDYSIESELIE